MAKKDSKAPKRKPTNKYKSKRKLPKSKMLFLPTGDLYYDKLMKNDQRLMAITNPININIILGCLIMMEAFSAKNIKEFKEADKLMNSFNLIQKARLAYFLNIIDETHKKDLEQIHEIRNKFAHDYRADFSHKDILKYVKKLSAAKGKEVTEKNSCKFYESSVLKCIILFEERLLRHTKTNKTKI